MIKISRAALSSDKKSSLNDFKSDCLGVCLQSPSSFMINLSNVCESSPDIMYPVMQPQYSPPLTSLPRRPSQSSLPVQLRINTSYNVRRNPSVSSSIISRSNTGASRRDLSTTTNSPITPSSQVPPLSYQKMSQQPSTYTSRLRKQSGTSWCDHAQPVDPEKLNAKRLARQKTMADIDKWNGQSKSVSGVYLDDGNGTITYAIKDNINMIGAAAPTTMLGNLMRTDTPIGNS